MIWTGGRMCFALGLLLYEMATGKQAFQGRTGGAIIEAILTKTPPPVRTIESGSASATGRDYSEVSGERSRAAVPDGGSGAQRSAAVAEDFGVGADHGDGSGDAGGGRRREQSGWKTAMIVGGTLATVAVLGAGWIWNGRRAHALTQTDTIVLADFVNKTPDPIFDGTLRQGLAAQLQQSPFLSLLSDQRIEQTLRMMGQPADAKLTPQLAAGLCQRSGSKAYLSGSISNIGSQYVMEVSAVNCQTGDSMAQEHVMANGKDDVLKALSTSFDGVCGKSWGSR